MTQRDAAAVARLAIKGGLLTESQLREVVKALGVGNPPVDQLLRTLERTGYLTPWQSQKLLKGEKDGYFLGGYRLLYRISSGSFGRVFRAVDPQSGEVVAVKILRKRWSERRRTIELFEREGKLGLTLRHPNIVSVLAVGFDTASRQYYIAMEFVEGGNLRELLKIRHKLEPGEAIRLLEDCVAGLAYAYSLGLTHRDVKPTNILVSTHGTAKLVDFGLADISNAAEQDAEEVDRTVDYAGLEEATGAKAGDVRSDIYFLGCVFFQMLTGRFPLVLSRDKYARMRRDRFISAPPLRAEDVTASPEVLHALNGLVGTMMALNPGQRFQTPAQLLEAVQEVRRVVEGKATITPPAGEGDNAGRKTVSRQDSGEVKSFGPSVYIIERDTRLQNTLRDGFKKKGFRVLLSTEAATALNHYRQKPFDALVVDAGTSGPDSVRVFDQMVSEAKRRNRPLAALMLLSEGQADVAKILPEGPAVSALVRPLTLSQVLRKLRELLPAPTPDGAPPAAGRPAKPAGPSGP